MIWTFPIDQSYLEAHTHRSFECPFTSGVVINTLHQITISVGVHITTDGHFLQEHTLHLRLVSDLKLNFLKLLRCFTQMIGVLHVAVSRTLNLSHPRH